MIWDYTKNKYQDYYTEILLKTRAFVFKSLRLSFKNTWKSLQRELLGVNL